MPRGSEQYARSMADLMMAQGAVQAEAARRKGEIWGSTMASLGQIPQQVQQMRQQRDDRALMLEDRAQQRQLRLTQQKAADFEMRMNILEVAGRTLGGSQSKEEWAAGLHLLDNQFQGIVDVSKLPQAENWSPGLSAAFRANTAAEQKRLAELKPPAQYTLGRDQVRYDSDNNEVARGPQSPAPLPTQASIAFDAAGGNQQAATALESLQAPTVAQRDEIARHNTAMESISRMTAGRQEAAAAEAASHNRTMERIAQQNADTTKNRYTSSGIDSTMAPAYSTALERAVLSVPASRRPAVATLANRLWSEGNKDELKDVIRQAAIESENVDTKAQVLGRRATLAALRDARTILNEMKAKGVPTNWITGSMENLARRLGKTTNTEYVTLGNRLMGTLIEYRRATTGVQFSQREQAQYARMFPNYKNEPPVNEALIAGLEREIGTHDREYWTHKLGKSGATLVGVNTPSSTGPPEDTEGVVNGVPAVWKTVNGKAGWYAK